MKGHAVYFESEGAEKLHSYLYKTSITKTIIICDTNTVSLCLPLLLESISLDNFETVVIPAGEKNKTIATCELVWSKLTELNTDRR